MPTEIKVEYTNYSLCELCYISGFLDCLRPLILITNSCNGILCSVVLVNRRPGSMIKVEREKLHPFVCVSSTFLHGVTSTSATLSKGNKLAKSRKTRTFFGPKKFLGQKSFFQVKKVFQIKKNTVKKVFGWKSFSSQKSFFRVKKVFQVKKVFRVKNSHPHPPTPEQFREILPRPKIEK